MTNTEPRKLSELLDICLHAANTLRELRYGMCTVASELWYRSIISHEEMKIVKAGCMNLVSETRLRGGYKVVCLLRQALLQRLQGKHIVVDDLCYLIYSCWIDKLESEDK